MILKYIYILFVLKANMNDIINKSIYMYYTFIYK